MLLIEACAINIGAFVLSYSDILFAMFIQAIRPYSGHYHPTEQNLSKLLNFLQESGIDIADVQVCIL